MSRMPYSSNCFSLDTVFHPLSSKSGDAQAGLSPGANSQLGPTMTRSPYPVASKCRGSVLPTSPVADWAKDTVAQVTIAAQPRKQRRRPAIELTLLSMETTILTPPEAQAIDQGFSTGRTLSPKSCVPERKELPCVNRFAYDGVITDFHLPGFQIQCK